MLAIAEINYRVETSSLRQTSTLRYSPETGVINSAILHFPAGCRGLVEVYVYLKKKQILPTPVTGGTGGSIGIALDDTTQSFGINQTVQRGDPVMVDILNHDGGNDHTISVVILIETKLEYTGP